ncbi:MULTISPECIES: VUT family protein [unclassified Streptomyces]|uniref:VUT family protein n=1 Tax=unclassified Streptomyces TaxID=2593676 RepID=UPI0033179F5A
MPKIPAFLRELLRPFALMLLTTAYAATVPAANVLIDQFGAVPVGFGLTAPAGVFMAGVALVLRDLIQEQCGYRSVLCCIAAGSVLSLVYASPGLALASVLAFALSELVDTYLYTRVRAYGLKTAALTLLAPVSARARLAVGRQPSRSPHGRLVSGVIASNAVSLVVDSLVFLWLAFDSFAYLPGQLLAKAYVTLLGALISYLLYARRQARE